ncbi:hypothetical protein [Gymnodinialimonas ulvae]|uniref:hypothetical protein n=1 Tax=Gymnodinialimonas ulvae TaxID=3126504 RepID=UPI0030AC346F
MIRALTLGASVLASPVGATGLACTFTDLCAPLTDCQSHPGLPFTFELIDGALALSTAEGIAFGTPLSHVEAPALSLIFDTRPDQTLLLSVSNTGQAAMTQHDFEAAGRLTSVSYFGTCEPAS